MGCGPLLSASGFGCGIFPGGAPITDGIEEIRLCADQACQEAGVALWDVRLLPEGRRTRVEVIIDREGGVGLGDCEAVSERVAPALDEVASLKQGYDLDVASPGPERRLRSLDDVAAYAGHRALVTLQASVAGRRRFTGLLADVQDGTFRLHAEDGREHVLSWADVHEVRLKPQKEGQASER